MSALDDARRAARRVRGALRNRRLRRHNAAELARRAPLAAGTVEVAVFFADPAVNLYQVRQWYEPLRRLAETHPVVVLTRAADSTAALLRECPVPVVPVASIGALEVWLQTQPVQVLLYVNQNRENFSVLRFTGPAHVFVSHGESDKSYMASNQLKAYDEVFVAGPAAVRRIEQHVIGLDPARLVQIGRPQVDVEHEPPPLPADGRTVVLYAPTWEGDRPSMDYSSVLTHGAALVAALAGDPRFRVVYRPHPRTGEHDRRYRAAHERVVAVLDEAGRRDPQAGHLVDTGSAFGWHLRAADVCVTDVSAVAFDWMATGKPIVLTAPASPSAVVGPESLAARLPTLAAQDAHDVVRHVDAARGDAGSRAYAALVADHFGDTAPGASMARFLAAVDELVRRRAAERSARADDAP
ncbi:CDP-glycerol--glycerophosphate glycerophosphotransferase [Cellulomonas massiliensis]|uniref:CDP-glycerol--glycerophosphate glycerophosphotransferase n=1 Tax=Cellulomonas massiliensis TaxID=1465811 RepID=UPI0002FDE97E|nr:CDP-glycerol--glycerophosphate glycerophosphotransferase [Cellulomonas massiliensis]